MTNEHSSLTLCTVCSRCSWEHSWSISAGPHDNSTDLLNCQLFLHSHFTVYWVESEGSDVSTYFSTFVIFCFCKFCAFAVNRAHGTDTWGVGSLPLPRAVLWLPCHTQTEVHGMCMEARKQFLRVGSVSNTWVIRLGSQCLDSPSHLLTLELISEYAVQQESNFIPPYNLI